MILNGDIQKLISTDMVKKHQSNPSRGSICSVHVGVARCFDKHFYQHPLRVLTTTVTLSTQTSASATLRINAALAVHSGPTAPRLQWERHQINYLPCICPRTVPET